MGADGNPYDDPYSLPNDVAKVDDEQLSRMGPGEKRRRRCFNWSMRTVGSYLEFGMPGLGMFIEGYIIFASGQTGGLRKALYPACWAKATESGCSPKFVEHYSGYIAIVGVIAGMLLVGAFGDFFGRKWGSRSTAILMLLTTILLTFTPLASTGYGNLAYYTVALTFFGVAVGGEYPMASTSASERAAWRPGMAKNRGRHVALVFSNQGLGTFVNGCVILLGYLFFEQYGSKLSTYGSRAIIALQYAVGVIPCIMVVLWRFLCLDESELYKEEDIIEHTVLADKATVKNKYYKSMKYWGWRQIVASIGWFINDFAFYGQKLDQTLFISLIHPGEASIPWLIQRYTVLNAFIALVGYYMAAWLIDYKWYGRCRMQYIGFFMVFVFQIIIYGQWYNLNGSKAGGQAFQFLYYMTSFFQQLGPNVTTWIVASEMFPTDVRASNNGWAAAIGKFGAIMSSLWLSYIVDKRAIFIIAAMWSLGGALITFIMLPDTTGLELQELDRMQRYMLEDRFHEYTGEAVNPHFISLWERFVLRWGKQYNPEQDRLNMEEEMRQFGKTPEGLEQLRKLAHITDVEKVHVRPAEDSA